MLVAVDSSVWIEFFRDAHSTVTQELRGLLEEDRVCIPSPVWIELLSGVSKKELPGFRQLLSAVPKIYPSGKQTWKLLEHWILLAQKRGRRFGFADLLIGAIAAENKASIWSLDEDFKAMAKIKLVKLY